MEMNVVKPRPRNFQVEGQGFGFLLGEWIRVRPYKRRFGGWEAVEVEGMGGLGGGNSNIFYFHPYLGKIPILRNTFQLG